MKAICIALALLLLSGCMHNSHRTEEAKAHYAAQEKAIEARKPIFELRASEGETIVLQGVSALIVHDPREQRINPMPQAEHPFWGIVRATLPSLVTGYVGLSQARYSRDISREQYSFLGRVIDAAQPSITVGGDYVTGQVGDNAGRDYITGHVGDQTHVGRDQVGRDQTHVGRDSIIGDRNQNRGRQDSPGPIDDNSGDCRGGADCSAPPPPPPDPEDD